jgi:hypothetical protein
VLVAEVLEDAYATALATEQRPELLAVLQSWGSVHDALGRAPRP